MRDGRPRIAMRDERPRIAMRDGRARKSTGGTVHLRTVQLRMVQLRMVRLRMVRPGTASLGGWAAARNRGGGERAKGMSAG